MDAVIRIRRDQKYDWESKNPILLDGEMGFEKDTGKLKIGNGYSRWTSLDYLAGEVTIPDGGGVSDALLQAHIDSLTPHPVYDDGPDLVLLYENAKV